MLYKEKYRELCKVKTSIPIFSRDWWMDSVCGIDNWDVIIIEKGGQVVAAMPYFIKLKRNRIYITQPLLTQTNGIWIEYPKNQKYATKLSFEKDIIGEVIEKLESLNIAYLNQSFHYSFTNILPLYWKQFTGKTFYTYIFDDLKNIDCIYSGFQDKVKTDIKKANRIVEVKEDCNIEEFYNINFKTYERQRINISYTLDFLRELDNNCLRHNCRKIFYAVDQNKKVHAAIYIVWDENSAYYLLSGGDPELRNSGATSLLVWHAIQFASTVTKKFDFEGSMVEPIERFFRGFGAIQKPYFNVSKDYRTNSAIFSILKCVYNSCPNIQKLCTNLKGYMK